MRIDKKIWITTIIGAAIALCVSLFKGIYKVEDAVNRIWILSDAFFTSGVLIAGVGLLILVANEGNFDMLSYGVKSVTACFKKKGERKLEKTLFEYKMAKQDRRVPTKHLLVVGSMYLFFSAILSFVFSYLS